MIIGQLGDEAAGDAAGPLAVDAAVGGVDYEALMARSCDSDIGEAAFFLEGRVAAFVERALRGEDAFLPAGEEDGAEFEALGGVDGHEGDLFLIAGGVVLHDEADTFQEGAWRSEERRVGKEWVCTRRIWGW